MSHIDEQTARTPPPLGDLLARYLDHQAAAQAAGLSAPDMGGEVVPFDAAPVQTVDPRLAWQEANTALTLIGKTGVKTAPPEWPLVVAGQEPIVSLAFAAGNFPQMVRVFQPMLHQGKMSELRTAPGRAVAAPALTAWVEKALYEKKFPQSLLGIGALRLARQFDLATDLTAQYAASVPAEWQAAWANETAALLWHSGKAEEAASAWQTQAESVPVLFNRGLAALFLDRPTEALTAFNQVAKSLPETGAWFHLAQLYSTLAKLRA
jgi:tetratricopeptide (TPR) repeat protein